MLGAMKKRAPWRLLRSMAASAVLSAALWGCTMPSTSTPVDSAGLATIHKIALIPPAEPALYELRWNMSYVLPLERLGTQAFLPNGNPLPPNETVDTFRANLVKENVVLGSDLATDTAAALRKQGYEVVIVPADHPKPAAFLTDLSALRDRPDMAGVDAVLDLVIPRAGYAHAVHHYYNPAIRLDTRLTALSTGGAINRQLAQRTYYYVDPVAIRASDLKIPAEAGYDFKDGGKLLAEPDRAAKGLRSGLPHLADAVAADLKR